MIFVLRHDKPVYLILVDYQSYLFLLAVFSIQDLHDSVRSADDNSSIGEILQRANAVTIGGPCSHQV